MSENGLIVARGLSKSYTSERVKVKALANVSLSIPENGFVVIVGQSGSGKSTLLHILGGLDSPSAGKVIIDGRDLGSLPEGKLTLFRKHNIGFVFQFFHLIPTLTARENVVVSRMFDRGFPLRHADEALKKVGLKKRLNHLPSELSGGEQQRVAIARAIMNRPRILFADEPTGNLDSVTGKGIMEIFSELNKNGTTVVLATHETSFKEYASQVLHIHDGKITDVDAQVDEKENE